MSLKRYGSSSNQQVAGSTFDFLGYCSKNHLIPRLSANYAILTRCYDFENLFLNFIARAALIDVLLCFKHAF